MARTGRAFPSHSITRSRKGAALVPPPIAVLTGTITASVNEADIRTGGKTLIITLTGDTWIAAGAASFDLQRQPIINGVTSAQTETLGWDLVPKALQGVAGVVRTSNTVVTITWDAFPTYNITAQETITVTVPGTAVVLGGAIVATPTFTVAVVVPADIVPQVAALVFGTNNLLVSSPAAIQPQAAAIVLGANNLLVRSPALLTPAPAAIVFDLPNVLVKSPALITPQSAAIVFGTTNVLVHSPALMTPQAVPIVFAVTNLLVHSPIAITPQSVAIAFDAPNVLVSSAAVIAPQAAALVFDAPNVQVGSPAMIQPQTATIVFGAANIEITTGTGAAGTAKFLPITGVG